MGEIRTLDQYGDTKTIWDPKNKEEVELAEETFNRLKKKGYTAYKVNKLGNKSSEMKKFDPDAGKLIMVPKIVGG